MSKQLTGKLDNIKQTKVKLKRKLKEAQADY